MLNLEVALHPKIAHVASKSEVSTSKASASSIILKPFKITKK